MANKKKTPKALKTPRAKKKISRVMREFKEGKLKSGPKNAPKVKNEKQAIAIALSEAAMKPKKKKGTSKKKGK